MFSSDLVSSNTTATDVHRYTRPLVGGMAPTSAARFVLPLVLYVTFGVFETLAPNLNMLQGDHS